MRCKTRNQTDFFMLCKTQIRLILFCGLWCKTQASCQLKINLYGVTQARIVLLCAVQLKLDLFLYVLNNSTQTHHMYMSSIHPCVVSSLSQPLHPVIPHFYSCLNLSNFIP